MNLKIQNLLMAMDLQFTAFRLDRSRDAWKEGIIKDKFKLGKSC